MSGRSLGTFSTMTLKNSKRETEFNWLVRLKKTAARVGGWCARWGASMNFLIASCIALKMNDIPLGMLAA